MRIFQILSKDIFLWKSLIRLASIDCENNSNLCKIFGDKTLPSFEFFSPFSNANQVPVNLRITAMRFSSFRNKLVNAIKNIKIQTRNL